MNVTGLAPVYFGKLTFFHNTKQHVIDDPQVEDQYYRLLGRADTAAKNSNDFDQVKLWRTKARQYLESLVDPVPSGRVRL